MSQPQHRAKQRAFQKVVEQSIRDAYDQMRSLLDTLPAGDIDGSDEEAANVVKNIWAIEEEWILDEDLRTELSLLQCDEDDEDD